MTTYTEIEEFLQAVFGDDWRDKAFLCNSGDWRRKKLEELDPELDCYWCVGAIPWGKARKAENVEDVRALVIDDVGTKIPEPQVRGNLGQATAVTLTSKNNYQWAYRLLEPIAPDAWRGFFGGVEVKLSQKLDGGDAVHLFRLPMGKNTKPGKGNKVEQDVLNHLTKLRSWNMPTPIGPSGPKAAAVVGDGAEIKLGLDELREFMGWIDTKAIDRKLWVDIVGHGLRALCKDDEEGFTVFDEWSDPEKAPGYNRKTWKSLGAGGLQSKGGKLKALAQAANPEGFAKMFAPKVFDDDPPEPPAPPSGGGGGLTHVDMAETIVGRERGMLGWLSNGTGRWGAFDPVMGRWVIEEHDALMRAAVREEVHRRRLGAAPADAKRMAEAKWRGAVQGLLTRERRLMLPFDRFDADLDMFGVPGGVVRLGSRGISEEIGRARQMVSKAMSVRPGPRGAKGVAWEAFLDDFTMGDLELRAWWQAFCGYCLTGRVHEHAVVFLYGPGGNGKSVFLDTLAEVMGPYHERAGHTLFMATMGTKHTAAVADLVGARLVTSPDVPVGCTWDLGLIKPLTGGGTFKAQFMRENWFKFTPRFKLILAGNEKPALGGVDAAIRRRFWLVPAMHVPRTINKQLVDVLRGELPAILRWMMDGWEAYNIGGLPSCKLIDKETDEYLAGEDTWGKWKVKITKTPSDRTKHRISDLWNDWDAFRASEGSWKSSPVNRQALSTKLREAGFAVDRDNQGAYVDGITIIKTPVF